MDFGAGRGLGFAAGVRERDFGFFMRERLQEGWMNVHDSMRRAGSSYASQDCRDWPAAECQIVQAPPSDAIALLNVGAVGWS